MTHPTDRLGAYADGELPPNEARRVEEHLRGCTECSREVATIRYLGGAMKTIQPGGPARTIWGSVHRRLVRPLGWALLLAGVLVWLGLAAVAWFREELTVAWAAATAIGIGLVLLLGAAAYEQYRDWRDTPYKDVQQ